MKRDAELTNEQDLETKRHENEKAIQEFIDVVETSKLTREKNKSEFRLLAEEKSSEIRTAEHEARMASIQPGLINAILAMSDNMFAETLAKNLQHQNNGFGTIFEGGFAGLTELVKGSPLEGKISRLVENNTNIHGNSKN